MSKTKIEWATDSWNPLKVRSGGFGCTKVSPGCLNCYAGRMNKRLFGGRDYDYIHKPTDFYLDQKTLEQPLHWRKPRTVFVCSMCDLFHENVSAVMQEDMLDVMQACPQHTFLLLTKRPDQMNAMMQFYVFERGEKPIPNIWLGVTAENQEQADKRIPILLSIPAAKYFVSVEPMLGAIDFYHQGRDWLQGWDTDTEADDDGEPCPVRIPAPGIDWVICGGESGPGARPVHPGWVRSLRDQCVAASVPFFFKQWGAHVGYKIPIEGKTLAEQLVATTASGHLIGDLYRYPRIIDESLTEPMEFVRVGKKAAGRLLDGVEWNQFPRGAA